MNKTDIINYLKLNNIKPSKSKGQNFLIEPAVVFDIIKLSNIQTKVPTIIEIGPGIGAMTEHLNELTDNLILIEIEDQLAKNLKFKFPNATIINQDVREVDFSQFGKDLIVFGNLPYSFSSDIIFHFVNYKEYISSAILMLQKEFVNRLKAEPNSKAYSILSINLQVHSKVIDGEIVPPECFYPKPKVFSKLVKLDFYNESPYKIDNNKAFKKVLTASFKNRRKKLLNSLKSSNLFDNDKLLEIFKDLNFSDNIRAENLQVEEFVQLCKKVLDYNAFLEV